MVSGGRRAGAGRKPGALTKKTAEVALKVGLLEGISPIEIIMEITRFFHGVAKSQQKVLNELLAQQAAHARNGIFDEELAKAIQPLMALHQAAMASASTAAPYVHARLAARDFHFPPEGGMELTQGFDRQHVNNVDVPKIDEENEIEVP
jgi:hypothetical protein